jgi:broad specificity phosphatase PhoE
MPLPETLYTSPLARCLQTTWHALGPVVRATGGDESFHPVIKERLREQFTGHTCDRRRPRSWIAANWADYRIEDGFAEEDELAKLGRPETDEEHVARKQLALEDLFDNEDGQFVSWTCHSYAIKAILRACNTEVFKVAEGTSFALLIKGEKLT